MMLVLVELVLEVVMVVMEEKEVIQVMVFSVRVFEVTVGFLARVFWVTGKVFVVLVRGESLYQSQELPECEIETYV